jgi:hypothetical protein
VELLACIASIGFMYTVITKVGRWLNGHIMLVTPENDFDLDSVESVHYLHAGLVVRTCRACQTHLLPHNIIFLTNTVQLTNCALEFSEHSHGCCWFSQFSHLYCFLSVSYIIKFYVPTEWLIQVLC